MQHGCIRSESGVLVPCCRAFAVDTGLVVVGRELLWMTWTGRLAVGCAAAYLCRVDSLTGFKEASVIVRTKALWLG